MDPTYQQQVTVARLLFNNHWLSHAQQKCQAALALDHGADDEADDLLREIGQRLGNPEHLNLSQDHAPVTVMLEKGCIISTLHFRHLENDRLKREAFRQGVYYIDIETSSQCNRKCQYCPNSQNDRLSVNNFMPHSVFTSFMMDLHGIDYSKEIHFVGYNEPLLHIEDLLGRIALARKLAPKATIVVFTNGDYLERESVDQLVAAGTNEITVSVHLPPGKPYSDDAIFARITKIAERLGTPIAPFAYAKDTHVSARLLHDGVKIVIYQTDYDRLGSNRASTMENVGPQIDVRTAACLMPINQFIVGHQGAVVPCCVMVSDDPRNAQHIVGAIDKAASIFDIYAGRNFVQWRRGLFNLSPKQGPCRKCAWDVASPLLNAPAVYDPWQHLVSTAGVDPVVMG